MDADEQRRAQARAQADHQRGRAQTAEHQADRAETDHDRARFEGEARDAHAQADQHDREAEHSASADDPSKEQEAAERNRAWYLPGSVAQDELQQMEEAGQGPGLLEQSVKYAARSAVDAARDGVHEKSIAGRIGAALSRGEQGEQELPDNAADIVERYGAAAPEADAQEQTLDRPEVAMDREQGDGSVAEWLGKEEPDTPTTGSALVERFGAKETKEQPAQERGQEPRR